MMKTNFVSVRSPKNLGKSRNGRHVLVSKDMLEPPGTIGNNNSFVIPSPWVPFFRLRLAH